MTDEIKKQGLLETSVIVTDEPETNILFPQSGDVTALQREARRNLRHILGLTDPDDSEVTKP